MKRQRLSKSDIKELNKKLGLDLHKKDKVELLDNEYYEINNEIRFFIREKNILPTLFGILKHDTNLKKITIDMGAVKFVVNGADIMRPGITEIEDGIQKNEYIIIIDENNKKPLAIGQMLLSGEDCQKTKEGKVIKSIHYVGDEVWKFCTES